MTKKELINIIKELKISSKKYNEEMDRHYSELEKIEKINQKIDENLKSKLNQEQVDWFYWFCYENDFGKGKLIAEDKDGNPICRTVEELLEIINEKK